LLLGKTLWYWEIGMAGSFFLNSTRIRAFHERELSVTLINLSGIESFQPSACSQGSTSYIQGTSRNSKGAIQVLSENSCGIK
jgi:hypothetical protein